MKRYVGLDVHRLWRDGTEFRWSTTSADLKGAVSSGSSPPGRRRRASAIPATTAASSLSRTPLCDAHVRARQPGTANGADPVENPSPGGRGPDEIILDRPD